MIDIPLDRLMDAMERVQRAADYDGRLRLSMQRIGLHAVGLAKKETPVISGLLRANWACRIDGTWIIIENLTSYAAAWNYGHRQEVGRYVPAIGKKLVRPYKAGTYALEKAMGHTVKYTLPGELCNMMMDILEEFRL